MSLFATGSRRFPLLTCTLRSLSLKLPDTMSSNTIASSNPGSTNSNSYSFFDLPLVPLILVEWAAVIPLVCHLATYKYGWELVGRVSLTRRVGTSIFPKLGVLAGLSRLLERGPDFIDRASSKGGPEWKVWDVCWGGSWPCANGGASSMIVDYALSRRKGNVVEMPDTVATSPALEKANTKPTLSTVLSGQTVFGDAMQPSKSNTSSSSGSASLNFTPNPKPTTKSQGHRRYQTLHLIRFQRHKRSRSWLLKLDHYFSSSIWAGLQTVGILAVSVILSLLGIFGTAAILLCGSISQFGCWMVHVQRPPGYLQSNEGAESSMLVALHQNANTWYLFQGDRAVVDSLLNKTMISIPPSPRLTVLHWILKTIHIIQLLAMTYVAGQKGWDGITLVALMLIDYAMSWTSRESILARRWLEYEGVDVRAQSYTLTGRTVMMGAIQCVTGSRSPNWMDEIVAPVPRRNAWLARLKGLQMKRSLEDDIMSNESGQWSQHDWQAIVLSSELAHRSAEMLRAAGNDESRIQV